MTGQAIPKIEALRVAANAGYTQREAANAVGIGVAYACVLAKQNGIVFTKPSGQRIALMRKFAAGGLSIAKTAERLGVTRQTVYRTSHQHGIEFARTYSVSAEVRFGQVSRAVAFAKLYREGSTLKQIGEQFGITRERVRQIMTKHIGIRANDGGQHTRAIATKKKNKARRDARSLKKWGCRFDQYVALRAMKKPTRAYERGTGRGYCMCRLNDTGPYAADNVYIATGVENIQDYWAKERANPSRPNRCLLSEESRREKARADRRAYYYRQKAARRALPSQGVAQ